MPGTTHAAIHQRALIERPAGVYTRGRQGVYLSALEDQNHRHAAGRNPHQRMHGEIGQGGDVGPLADGVLEDGVVDADPLVEGEGPAR